jgi:hypothetical protein
VLMRKSFLPVARVTQGWPGIFIHAEEALGRFGFA